MVSKENEVLVAERLQAQITTLQGKPITARETCSIKLLVKKCKAVGLLTVKLEEAAQQAYTKRGVRNQFSYFCGIVWRMVVRTQRGSLGEAVGNYGRLPWS